VHNNYHFLRHLVPALHRRLQNFSVGEIFSQNKNELILSFYKSEDTFFIKAHLDPSFCCLSFPLSYARARRNSVDLFEETRDLKVIGVTLSPHDRSFRIELESNYLLFFKMYGNRSNIILFKGRTFVHFFNKKLSADTNLDPNQKAYSPEITFENFKKFQGKYKKLIPTLGSAADGFFEEKAYETRSINEQWNLLQEFLTVVSEPTFYICEIEGLPALRLYPGQTITRTFGDPVLAINFLFITYVKKYALLKHRQVLEHDLTVSLKKNKRHLKNAEKRLNSMKTRPRYQQMADIIMANIHNISPGSSTITLFDFYNNGEINIELKPTLSPQKNAERYYRKGKNEAIEINALKSNIDWRQQRITQLEKGLQDLSSAETMAEIQEIQGRLTGSSAKTTVKDQPFISHHVEGFDILIGKNNRTNDLLTFKTAKKDDLWLHVKDAAGAHVIIKQKPGTNFSKQVIERAAELAAYHSRRKNETVCPVSYTPRKYVRKTRDLQAGEVIVDRERVIIVQPRS